MKTTSVSELKNTLSAQLKTVMAGEALMVTDRNRPVAVLQPIHGAEADHALAGLAGEGLVQLPRKSLNLRTFFQKPRARCRGTLTQAILEERESR